MGLNFDEYFEKEKITIEEIIGITVFMVFLLITLDFKIAMPLSFISLGLSHLIKTKIKKHDKKIH